MILHIFRKDWKLLWKFFVIVSALQFIPVVLRVKLGLFGGNPILDYLLLPAVFVSMMGIAFLAVFIVHQDPIPGLCQDWLVRPLVRRDLLLAKLLFGLVLIQVAVFAGDCSQALVSGIPIGWSLVGALSHNVYLGVIITLPALAIASATANVMEAIVGASLAFFLGMGVELTEIAIHGGRGFLLQSSGAGSDWIGTYLGQLAIVIGVFSVLFVQYYRRKTAAARWVSAATLLIFLLAQFLPWHFVFGLQQKFSSNSQEANAVVLTFSPGAGRLPQAAGPSGSQQAVGVRDQSNPGLLLALPLHVSSLPGDSLLNVDKADIQIVSQQGKVVYRTEGNDWQVHQQGTNGATDPIYQKLVVPESVYRQVISHDFRMVIDLSLTLSVLDADYSLPSIDGIGKDPGLGLCETRLNDSGSSVELRCIQPGNGSTCRSAYLENGATGLRNSEIFSCIPNYAPQLERMSMDPMTHFGLNLPVRDPAGPAKNAIDGSELANSKVVVQVYKPQAHFVRRVIISPLDVSEWKVE